MWAYVENDKITEFEQLPTCWRNISNLPALEKDLESLSLMGWYPLVDDTVAITDDFTQYHGEPVYQFDTVSHVVRKNCPILIKDIPSAEESFFTTKSAFLEDLRSRRNQLLKDSDWTQAVDIQETKSVEFKTSWATYRRQLRDLPQIYSAAPYENIVDSNQVDWPKEPRES